MNPKQGTMVMSDNPDWLRTPISIMVKKNWCNLIVSLYEIDGESQPGSGIWNKNFVESTAEDSRIDLVLSYE